MTELSPSPTAAEITNNETENLIKSKKPSRLLIIGGAVLILALLVLGLLWWKYGSQGDQQKPSALFGTPTAGVELRSTSPDELSPLQPIDQTQLASALQLAWTDAITKAPQNAVKFPSDPNLVAFQLQLPDQEEPESFVVYANRPVIVETNPVESLPNDQIYQIDFDRDNYQLVIKFSYTPQVTSLDLPQVLTDAFNQILNHRRLPQDVESNPITTDAFQGG